MASSFSFVTIILKGKGRSKCSLWWTNRLEGSVMVEGAVKSNIRIKRIGGTAYLRYLRFFFRSTAFAKGTG